MSRDHSDAARTAFGIVISFTGVVLAFLLVQAQGNLRNIDTQVTAEVTAEAHDLAQMDRLLIRYGTPSVARIRAPLYAYANSIVNDEWPQLRKGRSSARTSSFFMPVSQGVMAIEPAAGRQSLIYSEILKKVDELAGDRADRNGVSVTLKLPPIFWEVMTCLLATLLVLAAFSETTLGRISALSGEGFAVALLVSLIFIFDQPFKGETSVSPAPIEHVMLEMQNRTF